MTEQHPTTTTTEVQKPDIKIPENICAAFMEFRDNNISKESNNLLNNWILDMNTKDPTIDIAAIAREKFQYNEQRTGKLVRKINKLLSPPKTTDTKGDLTDKVLETAEGVSYKQFLSTFWEQTHAIAKELVVACAKYAKNEGYYDEVKQEIDMKSFLEDSMRFFMQYKNQIDDLVERAEHAETVAEIVTEMYKPQAQYIQLVKKYTEFVGLVQLLNAKGYKVPQFVLVEVEKLFNHTYQHLEALSIQMREKQWDQS